MSGQKWQKFTQLFEELPDKPYYCGEDHGLCDQSPVFLRTSAAPQAGFDGEKRG